MTKTTFDPDNYEGEVVKEGADLVVFKVINGVQYLDLEEIGDEDYSWRVPVSLIEKALESKSAYESLCRDKRFENIKSKG